VLLGLITRAHALLNATVMLKYYYPNRIAEFRNNSLFQFMEAEGIRLRHCGYGDERESIEIVARADYEKVSIQAERFVVDVP